MIETNPSSDPTDPTGPTGDEAADVLWFDRPASRWTDALPLGNGRQGVMVYGGDDVETLLINDATAWSGSPASESLGSRITTADAAVALEEARAAIREGRAADASAPLRRLQHRHSQAFLPFAKVTLDLGGNGGESTGYRRRLDLRTATHETRSDAGGHEIMQRVWASHPHRVVVVEIECAAPEGTRLGIGVETPLKELSRTRFTAPDAEGATLRVQLPSDVAPPHDDLAEPIAWDDAPGAAMRGALSIAWMHDGVASDRDGSSTVLAADGVRRATVVLSTATTFAGVGQWPRGDAAAAAGAAEAAVRRAFEDGVERVRTAHLADHSALYERSRMVCGGHHNDLPFDVRLGPLASGERRLAGDPALAGLLYNFGRYLLIASSRAGAPPANLQGIWNDSLRPPWSSNYTTNINLQMNYWPAETTQLTETAEPLFDLIDALSRRGRATARSLYRAEGWVAHHNTDAWGYTLPVGHGTHDPMWAFWPFAGAWLVQHLGWRLDFAPTRSEVVSFARERAWLPVRGAAEFVLSWLRDDGHTLSTSPSTSPENQFVDGRGLFAPAGTSSTADLILARDTMALLVRVAEIIGEQDDEIVQRARAALPRIPTPSAGSDGMVREWADDPPAVDPLHRHQSHLLSAFPGSGPLDDGIRNAVSRSLDGRGDESTGWSLAWRLALRARLRQPDRVSDLLGYFFRDMGQDRGELIGGIYPNMMMGHPPFQIDANFGYVAAIAECVMHSHEGRIDLLPALPRDLPDGAITGLVARGGWLVDVRWRDGVLETASILPRGDRVDEVVVSYGAARRVVSGRDGKVDLRGADLRMA